MNEAWIAETGWNFLRIRKQFMKADFSFNDCPKILNLLIPFCHVHVFEAWKSAIKGWEFWFDVSGLQIFQLILRVSKCDIILCTE